MEKNNYLISEMKIEDLENIKDILEVDFDEFWNYETLKEELESNFSKYFIAKQNDNIVDERDSFEGFRNLRKARTSYMGTRFV